ncbi:hypothetical protein Y630_02355 [Salmonella enterica subsp. enterica serovar Newport]|nr:hypothetical protein [Salmonella enterica subsp. enterica serovar Newport]EDI7201785.1 hypothetical protein [Salmonella enterica subsp. enterica serovar Newport]EEK2354853.1 hypothetical protein [Salmonella enterica subsp. enterica serovar Newport]EEK2753286.1 hypothetical protein [Salmonella enterica subsp. enterica serovar Newport]
MSEILKKIPKSGKKYFYAGCITGMVLCFVLINLLFSYDAIKLQRPYMGLFFVQAEIQCMSTIWEGRKNESYKFLGDQYRLAAYNLNRQVIQYNYLTCKSNNDKDPSCYNDVVTNYALMKRLDNVLQTGTDH